MKFTLFPLALLILAIATPGLAGASGDFAPPDQLEVRTQITPSGQKRLVQLGYELLRRTMDKNLHDIPTTEKFGADLKKCKWSAVQKMTPEQEDKECFGFVPMEIWPRKDHDPMATDTRIEGHLEPVQIQLRKFSIPHLALSKNPAIQCQHDVCDVRTSIDQMNVKLDLRARSANDDGCDQVALPGIQLNLKNGKPIAIHLRFKITQDRSEPLKMIWDQSAIQPPPQPIATYIPPLPSDNGQKKPVEAGVCKKGQGFGEIVRNLLPDVLDRPLMVNLILDRVKNHVLKGFTQREVKKLAKQNGFGSQPKRINAPLADLKQIADESGFQNSAMQQVAGIDRYLRDLATARSIPDIRSAAFYRKLAPSLKRFEQGFSDVVTPKSAQRINDVADSLAGAVVQLRLELQTLPPGFPRRDAAARRRLLENEIAWVQSSLIELNQARLSFRVRNQRKDKNADSEPLDLRAIALEADRVNGTVQATITARPDCHSINASAPPISWSLRHFGEPPHDIAIQSSYAPYNAVLDDMFQHHFLDTCVVKNGTASCDHADPGADKTYIHFGKSPSIDWDRKLGFVLRIPDIQLINQNNLLANLGHVMEAGATIPGKLVVTDGGKTLKFIPNTNGIHIDHANFKGGNWGLLIAWAAEQAVNSGFSHRKISSAIEGVNIHLPPYLTLTRLDMSKPGVIGLYADLPKDPSTLLGPDRTNSVTP